MSYTAKDIDDGLNHNLQNQLLYQATMQSIAKNYPIKGKSKTLKLVDIWTDDESAPSNDIPTQRARRVAGQSWSVPVYAHLRLQDTENSKVLEERKKVKLASVPKITPRFSMIIDGNEYQTVNQLRLKSGIYTREKENGEFESRFNLEKGWNFTIILNPSTGIYTVNAGNQTIRLYDLLKALDVSDEDIKNTWGAKLYKTNSKGGIQEQAWVDFAHKINKNIAGAQNAKRFLKDYMDQTRVDPNTTKITLNRRFTAADADAWLAASKKLLDVQSGVAEPDERDSLVFKNVLSVDDQVTQFMDKVSPSIQRKLVNKVERRDNISDMISSETYTKPLKRIFTTGDLTSTPPQTNPASIIGEWRKTTLMGTGGIQSPHAITTETRNVHSSQAGFLDPVNTPEGSKVGVNLSLAIGAKKRGNDVVTPVVMKGGKIRYITPAQKWQMAIAFGDDYKMVGGKPVPKAGRNAYIGVIKHGKSMRIPAREVDAYLAKPQLSFAWNTNLIPFISNTQGNRTTMGSNMVGQALVLDDADAPLVQNKMPDSDQTFEEVVGNYLNPTVPSEVKNGAVSKITDDYVYIKDKNTNKTHKVGLYNMFPMNQETYLHNTPKVFVGDTVKGGQELAKNNFQKITIDGKKETLGMGANVNSIPGYQKVLWKDDNGIHYSPIQTFHSEGNAFALSINKKGVQEWKPIINFIAHPMDEELVEITTLSGRKIEATKSHSMVVWDGKDIIVKKPIELSTSDRLPIVRKFSRGTTIDSVEEFKLTPDLGYIVGLYLSEESISTHKKSQVTFAVTDEDIKKEFERRISSVIGDKNYSYFNTYYTVYYSVLAHWLEENFGGGANYKVTPEWLFNAPKGFLKSLLAGYWAGNGTTTKKQNGSIDVSAYSNSKNLRDGIGEVCSILGIDYSIMDYSKDIWGIRISNWSLEMFPYFKHTYKYDKIKDYVENGTTKKQFERRKELGDVLLDKVKEIKTIPHKGWVYDFSVETNENFVTSNFLITHNTAYMPWKGYNFEDGTVITNSLSNKMTHSVIHKKSLIAQKNGLLNKNKFFAYFPNERENGAGNLDENGIIKTGSRVGRGDILIAYGEEREMTDEEQALKAMNRASFAPYSNRALKWTYDEPGEVLEVHKQGKKILVMIKATSPMVVGDKITGRYGNKMVVTKIIPDDDAPHTKAGERIDLMIAPSAIPSRLNPSQMLETAAGRVAKKRGQLYETENFNGVQHLEKLRKEMKAEGIESEEQLLDGKDGKPFQDKTFWGNQHFYKLMHVIDHKSKERSYGSYGFEEQPTNDPERGGQSVDPLMWYSMVGSGAKCFKSNTLIDTSEGPVKISDIYNNQEKEYFVKSWDGKNIVYNKVINRFKSKAGFNDLVDISYRSGTKITTTKGHQFYYEANKKGPVYDLESVLVINSGLRLTPINKKPHTQKHVTFKWMYNIEVEKTHNYFLSSGYLVGNSNLYDVTAVKGQKNDEIWRAIQLGQPIPRPQYNFAFDKMMAYMQTAGVDWEKNGDKISLRPMTDEKIKEMSSGELTYQGAGSMLRGKDLSAIPGGLFDPEITGGMRGTKWSHMKLPEPILNPTFEKPIQNILGINSREYDEYIEGKNGGVEELMKRLDQVDVSKEITNIKRELRIAPEGKVDKLNKKVRYLEALKNNNLNARDAYSMQLVPILPPRYRPVAPLPSGDLTFSRINNVYRNIALTAQGLESYKDMGPAAYKEFGPKQRKDLYDSIKEMQGHQQLQHWEKGKYEGALDVLAGSSPKSGFIQNKAWRKRQDLSARSTITLEPSLGVDEVGIPNQIAKATYRPFAVQKLVKMGYHPFKAIENVENETELGWTAIDSAMKDRPVILNRAPSLHKHSVQAFKPNRFKGKSIQLNPLIVSGYAADFDGDTMSAHVPVSDDAVSEAYKMMPSNMLYTQGPPKGTMPIIDSFSQQFILGIWYASREGNVYDGQVKNLSRAKKLHKEGALQVDDVINLPKVGRTTLGKELIAEILPKDLVDRSKVYNDKELERLGRAIAEKHPEQFATIISELKDLGNTYATRRGATLGFSDINIDRKFRDQLVKDTWAKLKGESDVNKQAKEFLKTTEKLDKEMQKRYGTGTAADNRFYHYKDSGAKGNPNQVRQINGYVGVLTDVYGNMLPPITKSWSEGIPMFDYWNHTYAVRKGAVDKSINTQDSGALNKALLGNTKNLLITEEDCGTIKGIDEELDGRSAVGRVAAKGVSGVVRRGQIIDERVVAVAQEKGLKTLLVRSPLTCETVNGLCKRCYGLMPDGQFPDIGENVGVIDGQAVTERSTQLVMKTRHLGGAATEKSGITAGFPELRSTLTVPQIQPNKAVLAEKAGRVSRILPSVAGGKEVYIDGSVHIIPPRRKILVKEKDMVYRGQPLSIGTEKPSEVAETRGFLEAQRGLVDRLDNVYDNMFHKRTFETVIKGISNNTTIEDAPNEAPWYRGDTGRLSAVEAWNKDHDETKQVKHRPFFKSIDVLPQESEDWLGRLGSNRLKQTITESAAKGYESNIHGTDPLPGYLYALEYGKGEFY